MPRILDVKILIRESDHLGWNSILSWKTAGGSHTASTRFTETYAATIVDIAEYLLSIEPLAAEENATMESTLPERTPAQDSQSARAFPLHPDPATHAATCNCPTCNTTTNQNIQPKYPVTK